uniref:AP2/ERF domain-containing protein n=1 Tax=viral metagenome TaxID=1070528 RepID=A0A6C0CHG2_9ZZZZ
MELDTVLIPLSGKRGEGKFARCDGNLISFLTTVKWHLSSGGYAKSRLGLMHRVVVQFNKLANLSDDLVVDHINGDRLDNRSINLRIATLKGNAKNKSNDPCHEGLVGVRQANENKCYYECVHKGIVFFKHEDPRMCALCHDSIVTYCYGKGVRLNDNKLIPLIIGSWNIEPDLMTILEKWRAKHTDFIGVKKCRGGWKATITVELGEFGSAEEAARAYDKALKTVSRSYQPWDLNFG